MLKSKTTSIAFSVIALALGIAALGFEGGTISLTAMVVAGFTIYNTFKSDEAPKRSPGFQYVAAIFLFLFAAFMIWSPYWVNGGWEGYADEENTAFWISGLAWLANAFAITSNATRASSVKKGVEDVFD